MAKKEEKSADEILYGLMTDVGLGRSTAFEASKKLREYVASLDDVAREDFRQKAPVRARLVTQIAELFHQELSLIGASS
jgi:hypothetical protein